MKILPCRTIFLTLLFASVSSARESLWTDWPSVNNLGELRSLKAEISPSESGSRLRLTASEPTRQKYAWATIPAPKDGWDLSSHKAVESTITNRGGKPVQAMLWIVGRRGWSAVGDFSTLESGESRRFAVDLRETYPDGSPKIDPSWIHQMQIMFQQLEPESDVEVSLPETTGTAPAWVRPAARLEVPDMEAGSSPSAGRRVRFQLPGDKKTEIYCALYLPSAWKPGERHPVIAEYPGNIFFNAKCYSTGRPEHCDMGYGMSEGKGAIWLSLPFLDRETGKIVEDGFGNTDDTAEYAIRAVEAVIEKFGGDRKNLVLTGFSRGSIACGYIGLRNERIAGLWKGIHGCQHYDGSRWHQSNMAGAVERAPRFTGRAIFQTDNSPEKYQPVVDATPSAVTWTWESSKLGFHSTAMFLDDRPSTLRLRKWYRELIATP